MKYRMFACIMLFSCALVSVFSEELTRSSLFAEQACGKASVEWKTEFSNDLSTLLSDTRVSDYALKVTGDLLRTREFPEDPGLAAVAAFSLLAGTENALRRGMTIAEMKIAASVAWQSILVQLARENAGEDDRGTRNAGGNGNGNAYGLSRSNGLGALVSSLAHAMKDNQVVVLNRGQLKKTLDEKVKKDTAPAK